MMRTYPPGVKKLSTAVAKCARAILLYFLWKTGLYTTRQTGNLFGIIYSAVCRRVHMTKSKISKHNMIGRKYEHLKSLI